MTRVFCILRYPEGCHLHSWRIRCLRSSWVLQEDSGRCELGHIVLHLSVHRDRDHADGDFQGCGYRDDSQMSAFGPLFPRDHHHAELLDTLSYDIMTMSDVTILMNN
jgi:hypothetical protein